MVKYFRGNTEVNWSKELRGTHDNQGINDQRVASHNSRFGMRKINKGYMTIFPFTYIPMGGGPITDAEPPWPLYARPFPPPCSSD